MSSRRCPICGETRFEGLSECEACGHPFPTDQPAESDQTEWWESLLADEAADDVIAHSLDQFAMLTGADLETARARLTQLVEDRNPMTQDEQLALWEIWIDQRDG